MSGRYSLFLDAIRFFAAVMVAFSHFSHSIFTGDTFEFIKNSFLGHHAVIVFFVLSGFVIYYSVLRRSEGFADYICKRIARLYSVVIPALFIVLLLDNIGLIIFPEIYDGKVADDFIFLRFIINLFFLQEIQFFSFRYMSNGPLWSLGYEFWYYCIFGMVFFFKSNYLKFFTVAIFSLFVGLKILLLFPIWLLGLVVFEAQKNKNFMSFSKCLVLASISTFMMVCATFLNLFEKLITFQADFLESIPYYLGFSQWFISDYIFSILFSIFLFSMKFVIEEIRLDFLNKIKIRLSIFIRKAANATLTIYLFHFPVLLFVYAVFGFFNFKPGLIFNCFSFLFVIMICYFFSLIFEEKNGKSYKFIEKSVRLFVYSIIKLIPRRVLRWI